jgi:hypothetical protein
MAVGACSSAASGPVTLPSLSSSGTVSASSSSGTAASASATSVADAQVAAEVEAAVRAYFDAMDQATKSGVANAYRSRTSDKCTCRTFADQVEQAFRDGRVEGAGIRVEDLTITLASQQVALADVRYLAHAYRHLVAGTVTEIPSARVHSALRLELAGGEWLVVDEDLLQRTAS